MVCEVRTFYDVDVPKMVADIHRKAVWCLACLIRRDLHGRFK